VTVIDTSALARARDDVGVFAEMLVGEPLWPHQLAFARSKARTRAACCGRQSGKSRTLAVIGLHAAFCGPDRLVLVVSATDDAAKRLLSEVASLASSPILAGSVVDESKSTLVLSNGSRIVSVPASERQVRGWSADLLVVDEGCFVGEDVWKAARFTTIARGGRIVLASTPWGRRDRFFSVAYEAGLSGAQGYESFHWPSTASPLVSEAVLAEWRPSMTQHEYDAEVLALWTDDAGSYFSTGELEAAVDDDLELIDPVSASGYVVTAGVDWAFARDANAIVCVGPAVPPGWTVDDASPVRQAVLYVEERFDLPYAAWVDRIVELGAGRGMRFGKVRPETNGVGAMPSQELRRRLAEKGLEHVLEPVNTSSQSKQDAFGAVKLRLQQGRLVLPRHPGLLRQLSNLAFETLDSGSVRIAVPERLGHDDLAMSLALAFSGEVEAAMSWAPPTTTYNYITGGAHLDFEERVRRRQLGLPVPPRGDPRLRPR